MTKLTITIGQTEEWTDRWNELSDSRGNKSYGLKKTVANQSCTNQFRVNHGALPVVSQSHSSDRRLFNQTVASSMPFTPCPKWNRPPPPTPPISAPTVNPIRAIPTVRFVPTRLWFRRQILFRWPSGGRVPVATIRRPHSALAPLRPSGPTCGRTFISLHSHRSTCHWRDSETPKWVKTQRDWEPLCSFWFRVIGMERLEPQKNSTRSHFKHYLESRMWFIHCMKSSSTHGEHLKQRKRRKKTTAECAETKFVRDEREIGHHQTRPGKTLSTRRNPVETRVLSRITTRVLEMEDGAGCKEMREEAQLVSNACVH